jgi:hypothetical protein
MKARCLNSWHPYYHWYGARGIKVDPKWRDSFAAFLADVGVKPSPDHTLDRIDNDGNYEPGNVRWATWAEQTINKRHRCNATLVAVEELMMPLAVAARIARVNDETMRRRLRRGWSLERALTVQTGR